MPHRGLFFMHSLQHIAARPDAVAARPRRDFFGASLLAMLVLGLAWAPFWLGANRPLAWGVNGLIFPAMTLVYEGAALVGARPHGVGLRHVAAPAALLFAALLFAFVQTLTPAPEVMAHPIWSMASEALGRLATPSISVNRSLGALAILRLCTDASVFWLALQLSRDPARGRALLMAIGVIVTAYAAYGLYLTAFLDSDIPFIDAPPPQGGVRSTFVNRNHFATYAGLGLVVVVGLVLQPAASWADGWRRHLGAALRIAGVLCAFVLLAALVGSTSRGGVAASGLALLALVALQLRRGVTRANIGALIAATLALGVVLAYFSSGLMSRIAVLGALSGESRAPAYAIVAGAILDNPILGLGYGAFADAFPLYRDRSIPTVGVWDKAHNSFLETWLGLGLIFGTALIAALLLLAGQCLKGALLRRRDWTAPAIAAAASLLVGVHALVDFSLQIEAVALTYMAILGAGVAQSQSGLRSLRD